MSKQNDPGPALRYHLQTQHDRWSLKGHGLDWDNQPQVFKSYSEELGLAAVALPEPREFPGISLQEALAAAPGRETPPNPLDMAVLSRVLVQAYGLTAQSRHRNGIFYYRSAPSAGALYPVEVYVALDLDLRSGEGGKAPARGVHHYDPLNHGLVELGRGDAVRELAKACELSGDAAPVAAFVCGVVFFRSSWKYRERAYRYCLLDAGHVLENLLLALRAEGLGATLHYDFEDEALNRLLGLDHSLEAALAVVFVHGQTAVARRDERESFQTHGTQRLHAASRVAPREERFREIEAAHLAGMRSGASTAREETMLRWEHVLDDEMDFKSLPDQPDQAPMATPALSEVIFSRRSKRNFVPEALPLAETCALLRALCVRDPEGLRPESPREPLLLAVALRQAGGAPLFDGLHALRREDCGAARLHAGNVGEAVAHICLGQEWLKNANCHLVLLTDLRRLEEHHGARVYRHALLEAGRLGQRAYLAAAALGLGACGVGAFYDQEAATFLGLGGRAQPLYFVGLGKVRK